MSPETLDALKNVLTIISNWSVPTLILIIVIAGAIKKVKMYEVFVEGAKEGFTVGVTIMPYLVAILCAIGMLREVGGIDIFASFIEPVTSLIYLPAEVLPMAIIRPLTGGGAIGVMNSIFFEYGPDSYYGVLASVMMGSTETTFYILAVYFGAANVKNPRHAVAGGLIGDLAGMLAAVFLTYVFFNNLYPG